MKGQEVTQPLVMQPILLILLDAGTRGELTHSNGPATPTTLGCNRAPPPNTATPTTTPEMATMCTLGLGKE